MREFRLILSLPLLHCGLLILFLHQAYSEESENSEESGDGAPKKNPFSDYYSSLAGIQELARKEQDVVKQVAAYRKRLTDRLKLVDDYLDDYSETIQALVKRSKQLRKKYENEQFPNFEDSADFKYVIESTSANPLMVYKLIRRFGRELPFLASNVTENDLDEEINDYFVELADKVAIPNKRDMQGAAAGLLNLQEAYQLSAYQMANGRLNDKQTGCRLKAFDMLYIGAEALDEDNFATAAEWFYIGYERALEEKNTLEAEELKKFLVSAKNFHNKRFLQSKKDDLANLFTGLINSNMTNIPKMYIPPPVTEHPIGDVEDTIHDIFNFYALCRGETLLPPKKSKSFRCFYSTGQSLYHIISPFKVEMHHENPPVYQIYDLISDEFIKYVQNIARPYLARSQVVADNIDEIDTKGGKSSDTRTSSVSWLMDTDDKWDGPLCKIPKLIERLTGLVVRKYSASELLQISCYGSIGGYYTPHLDALIDPRIPPENRPLDFERGDRVATIMFYLTDVELGGGTAFPRLGIASQAVKGSAMLWYNLQKNGERELLMLHGGCPVLYGNKWVANKWIRYKDQLHTRKCTTNQTE